MEPQASINDRLSNEQSDIRAAALAEILQSGVDVSPYINAVAACLNDPFEPLRILALMLLARIGAAATEFIALALSRRQPESFRATAAAILAGIGPSAAPAVRGLCRCLDSSDETLRKSAGIALAKIGEPAAPPLRLILPLTNPEAVAAAVDALALIGLPAESAVPELDALAIASPPQVQLACAAAISSITGDPERGLPILTKALESPDPSIRKTAA
jgi:HEAT repeat protein